MSTRVLDAIASEPWLITEPGLMQVVAIAERQGDLEAFLAKNAMDTARFKHDTHRRGDVAVIPVRGPIFRYANLLTDVSGATSLQTLVSDFDSALEDPTVSRIVLDIDSPGGQATGIADFADKVRSAGKPVTAFVGGTGASAAYWIASAASEIWASSTGLLGSIGVVSTYKPDASGNLKIISTQSPLKQASPTTEAGLVEWQRMVDDMASVFVSAVAALRGVPEEKVLNDFGRGGLLIGDKARAAGMADRVGHIEELITGQQFIRRSGRAGKQRMSARQQFDAEVATHQSAGMSKGRAVRQVVIDNPDLHAQYLAEVRGD